jgi:predicted DNA-binding WGR domain protein
MRLVRQTRLHFREGNSDKIYEVDLCETNGLFLVNFRYGKRGADLKEGTKTNGAVAQAEAEKIFQKLVDEKTRKGYQVLEEGQTEVAPKPKVAKVFDDAARRNYIVERLREAAAGSKKKHKWQLERYLAGGRAKNQGSCAAYYQFNWQRQRFTRLLLCVGFRILRRTGRRNRF